MKYFKVLKEQSISSVRSFKQIICGTWGLNVVHHERPDNIEFKTRLDCLLRHHTRRLIEDPHSLNNILPKMTDYHLAGGQN